MAIVAASLAFAACGGGDTTAADTGADTGSSSAEGGDQTVAEAKRAVEEASAPVTEWTGPTSSPPIAEGMYVANISCSPDTEGCQRPYKAAAEAERLLGWKVMNIQVNGSPEEFVNAMNRALDAGVDGITSISTPLSFIKAPLERAEQEGVWYVGSLNSLTPSEENPGEKGGFFSEIDSDNSLMGEIAADWLIAETNGEAKAGVITEKSFPIINKRVEGFEQGLADCTGCNIEQVLNVPVTELATALAPAVSQFLSANPETNGIFPAYGGAAALATPAVASSTVKAPVVTLEGLAVNLQTIREGGPIAADVAAPLDVIGYAMVDDLNRAFNGEEPAAEWSEKGGGIALKLITKANLPPEGQAFEGDYDFKAEFEKLWGLK